MNLTGHILGTAADASPKLFQNIANLLICVFDIALEICTQVWNAKPLNVHLLLISK